MEVDGKAFENKINMDAEAVNMEVELRTRELLRLRDEKQEAQDQEEKRRAVLYTEVPSSPYSQDKAGNVERCISTWYLLSSSSRLS